MSAATVNKRARLICLIGMDGSGKSTLANNLVSRIRAGGLKAKYVWNGSEPRILKPFYVLGKSFILSHEKKSGDYKKYSGKLNKTLQKPLVGSFYEWLLLIDYFFQILINIRIPLIFNINIVSDRYYFDIAINLMVQRGHSIKRLYKLLGRFKRMFPSPDIIFLVDLPEEEAYKRKNDIPSIEYLTERRNLYLNVANSLGIAVVDGTKSISNLNELLWERIEDYYK